MTDETQEQVAIDWAGAEVEDGELTVPFSGDPSNAWTERFLEVLELLQSEGRQGPWDALKVTKKRLRAGGIAPGTEGDVRYVLEAAVGQTNSDLAPPPEEGAGSGDAADQEMAAAFRSFAEEG